MIVLRGDLKSRIQYVCFKDDGDLGEIIALTRMEQRTVPMRQTRYCPHFELMDCGSNRIGQLAKLINRLVFECNKTGTK